MKSLNLMFAHDLPIFRNTLDNRYYSKSITAKFWERYLNVCTHLKVAVRIKDLAINNTNEYYLLDIENVDFIQIPNLSNPRNRYKNINRGRQILTKKMNNIDVIVVRLPSEVGYLAWKIARKYKIPVLIEMVGCPQDSYLHHGSILGKIYSPIARKKYKKVLEKSNHTIYVTENYLQEKYPTQGCSTNISNVNIKISESSPLLFRKQKISNDKKVYRIGMIGSLDVMYKGLDTGIQALSLLNKEMEKEVILEVVGNGEKNKWEKYAKKHNFLDKVIFKGGLSSDEVHNWLREIDIYIQPSKTEGLPRALIEAMSGGCPSIGSNVGGIPELLDKEFLFNAGDHKQLAEIINSFLNNKELMIKESERNYFKSKEYDISILDNRRREFMQAFISEVIF